MATKKKDNTTKKSPLGKGIGALLERSTISSLNQQEYHEAVQLIDVHSIVALKDQPRQYFDDAKLQELADSIRTHGVLQPILLRKLDDKRYELIAGERRWRASILANLKEIPAIVRDLTNDTVLEQALIENIQREDLKPLEEAMAYDYLMKNRGLTQEALSASIGKSRVSIANAVRLLKLPEELKNYLDNGDLSAGHARALLTIDDPQEQIAMADRAIEKAWSVRQIEEAVRLYLEKQLQPKESATPAEMDPQVRLNLKELETKLSKSLGAKVKLKDRNGKGKIEIPYKNNDDLERLLELLSL